MPKGSVPRNTTANFDVKKKRYFELSKKLEKSKPKKPRPSQAEFDKAQADYFDAADYPRFLGDPTPAKDWYKRKDRAKASNKLKEGLRNSATGQYSKERRVARDVRSDKSVGSRLGKKPHPVGKGGR